MSEQRESQPSKEHLRMIEEFEALSGGYRRPVTEQRCQTCTWWVCGDLRSGLDMWGIGEGWGQCERTSPERAFHSRVSDSRAIAFSMGAHYHEALYTAPDFGCVQWQAKDGDK